MVLESILLLFSSKLSCLIKTSSSESNFGWPHTVGDITLRLKLGSHKHHVSNKKNQINKSIRLCRNGKIHKINVKTCFTCSLKFLVPDVYNLLFKEFLIEGLKNYFKYLL